MLKKILIMLILGLFVACDPCDLRYGFPESCFKLATESRLPKWFDMPQGYSRNDVELTFCYYVPPFMKPRVIAKLKDRASEKILWENTGIDSYHPDSEKRGIRNYPVYVIITIGGVEEVFEHRQLGDIVYITDDPKLTGTPKKEKAPK